MSIFLNGSGLSPIRVKTLSNEETVTKPRRGRPPKSLVQSKKKGGRGVVGRPAGDGARIAELKARLLATTGDTVINKIVEIAMTDGHPVQGAALKMCIDRVLPLSYFEKDKQGNGTVPTISINISGITNPTVSAQEHEVIDAGITDVEVNNG